MRRINQRFVPALLALVAAASAACNGSGTAPEAPRNFPDVTALTGTAVEAPAGRLAASASVTDEASGAWVLVPAMSLVLTLDGRYDPDGDGIAESFAVTLGPVPAEAQAVGKGSLDQGATLLDVEFVGGFSCTPGDAAADQRIEMRIPAAEGHGIAQGQLLDVWRYMPVAGGGAAAAYWAYAGTCPVVRNHGRLCGYFETYELGVFALSRPAGLNRPPVIQLVTANPSTVAPGQPAQLSCQAVDPDGDAVTFAWSGAGTFDAPSASATSWRNSENGPAVLRCTVRDSFGHASYREAVLWVVGTQTNLAPEIVSVGADPAEAGAGESISLSCAATDPEGDALSYAWSGPGTFENPAAATTGWSCDVPGAYQLAVTVSDGHGHTASGSVKATVRDTQPPAWDGGDAAFQVMPREGYALALFGSAADSLSAPVTYTLYYGEKQGFPANATALPLGETPALPYRIDGLVMGTTYTFGVTASDSASPPNATPMATLDATPQPFYDAAPHGELEVSQSAQFCDIAAIAQTAAQIVIVWSEQGSGLKESHFSDGAWRVNDILPSKVYTLPRVFFISDRPAIVAADLTGILDLLVQQADGSWTVEHIFQRAGAKHIAVDVLYLPVARQLYIGHATATGWPPTANAVHFASRDLTGAHPVVIYDEQDVKTAAAIGDVRMRLDKDGNPVMLYTWGSRDPVHLQNSSLTLSLATYSLIDQQLSELTVDGFNPAYFDARATPAGWSLALVNLIPISLGLEPFVQPVLSRLDGTPGDWSPVQLDAALYTPVIEVPGAYDFTLPLECCFAPADTTVYYGQGTGSFFPAAGIDHAGLSLWMAPPLPPEPVPGLSLTRLRTLRTDGGGSYLAGIETSGLDLADTLDPSYMPSGRLLVHEIQ